MTAEPHLGVVRSDGVVTVTIRRPEKRNALHLDTFREFRDTFVRIAQDPADRVVILTGCEGSFSSGGEVPPRDPDRPPNPVRNSLTNVGQVVAEGARAIAECPKPVIVAVDGYALGAGMAVALTGDLVLATRGSVFGLPFVRHGLGVDCGLSWTLPRLVGMPKAKELAFFGDRLSADEALELGLLNRVTATTADLMALSRQWAERLVATSPTALQLIKRSFQQSATSTFAEALTVEAWGQVIGMRSGEVTG